jgi:D-cysteine desulfhydrase
MSLQNINRTLAFPKPEIEIGAMIRAAGGSPDQAAPRRALYQMPSPVRRLRRLEQELETGIELYVKRDDALRPLYGNKLRYIEYVIGAYDLFGSDCIVHCGGMPSNYIAQLSLAGAELGIPVHLIITGDNSDLPQGNPLLAEMFAEQVHYRRGSCSNLKAELAETLIRKGHRPLVIDAPFTNHSAILGYIRAWRELRAQVDHDDCPMPHHIMLCSAGNSYLGLRIGADLEGFNVGITGISPIRFSEAGLSAIARDREGFLRKKISEFSGFIGRPVPTASVDIDENFVGSQYGVPSADSVAAVRLLARTEGLLLDPIYTGKAMAGLLYYIRSNKFTAGTRVMFVHSGGLGNIFACHDALAENPDNA